MHSIPLRDEKVERCSSCGGLWFEAMEREKLKQVAGSEKIDTGDPAVGRKFNEMKKVNCPACKTPMIRMVDLKQNHIWYESCTVCGGVFFDAGEFKDYKKSTLADFFKGLFAAERK